MKTEERKKRKEFKPAVIPMPINTPLQPPGTSPDAGSNMQPYQSSSLSTVVAPPAAGSSPVGIWGTPGGPRGLAPLISPPGTFVTGTGPLPLAPSVPSNSGGVLPVYTGTTTVSLANGNGSGNSVPSASTANGNGGGQSTSDQNANGQNGNSQNADGQSTCGQNTPSSNSASNPSNAASPAQSNTDGNNGVNSSVPANPADALAGAQGDGATSGNGLGPASSQDGAMPSDGSPQNSLSAGVLGASGNPLGLNPPASPLTNPSVGGVLFNKPAMADFEIHELALIGAELLLIARDRLNRPVGSFTLNRTMTDAIMIAAKSLFLGDYIWLSIDPPSHYRESLRNGKLPPDGTPMVVSYGGCEGTAVGKCLYLCDLLFKHWSNGCNNETRQPIQVDVPGFRPYINTLDPRERKSGNWQRFWFVIDEVVLSVSPSGSILDSQVRIKALTETENNGGEQNPLAVQFTDHINRFFEDYVSKFRELAELKVNALAAATALWLFEQRAFDIAQVFSYQPTPVSTPASTPGIIVESPNVFVEQAARGTTTHKTMLFGGVDLHPKLKVRTDHRAGLQSAALAGRRGKEPVWKFSNGNATYIAGSIPLHRARFDVEQQPRLEIYEVACKDRRVLTRAEKNNQSGGKVLVVHEANGGVNLFRRVESQDKFGRNAYCRVESQSRTNDGVRFQFNSQDVLYQTWRNRYERSTQGGSWAFDHSGNMIVKS